MSLIGAINSYLDSSSSTQAVAFRTALGTGRVYSDRAIDSRSLPYVVVVDLGTTPIGLDVTHAIRVDSARVQFSCFARSGALVDLVLDRLENCFEGPNRATLTIAGKDHLSTTFANRLHVEDPQQDVFHGLVEFAFTLGRG